MVQIIDQNVLELYQKVLEYDRTVLEFNITIAIKIDVIINFEFNDFLFIFVPVVIY